MKKRKKKKMSTFAKGMLIYVGIALFAIFIFAIFFWRFIANYEASMPTHTIEKVVDDMKKGKWDKYFTEDDALTEFEGVKPLKEYIIKKCEGKTLTCIKAKEYTDTNPVYEVKADDVAFAKVTLAPNGKNKSNFTMWKYADTTYADYVKLDKYTIEAPSTTKVYVNGKELSDKYKTGDGEFDFLEQAALYTTNLPKKTVYTVENLINEPVVTAVDKEGLEVNVAKDYKTYEVGFAPSETVKEAHYDYVMKVASVYAKNFINVKEGILSYCMPESEFREAVALADTYFYPVEYMRGHEFLKRELTNFVYYNDDCFGCDVYVEINALFSGWVVSNKVEITNMNWVFVRVEDKWYLTSGTFK